ncbi:hypothetical protein QTP81_11165 [Alteromonas sp. ASW11-36]|uniref:Carbohydrate-binding domain-containing protein n=1 Tax=Alteromonas arenosi TaxID=3055817 RepID=A0ABT7SY91_9ALTE|nr:hypothetical protein [Alteromonas sp. ASW11-36]MDM7861158.1 hypothetical protein [Alteromonas sp. ASW11-36]
MKNISKLLYLGLSIAHAGALADEPKSIAINSTNESALLDGRCGNDEWEVASRLHLPSDVTVFLMQDTKYFYICTKGKSEDINVLDLYIESTEAEQPYKYHLSAQMGESKLTENGWESTADQGVRNGYAGLWVPYSGLKDPENRKNPTFERGSHRQVQITRGKFPGNNWRMMISVSGIKQKDAWTTLTYPENAEMDDTSTWGVFSF